MATLTDGELVKKTLRTTLVMLGTTALWLGALSGAVIVTTSTSTPSDSKVEKAAGPTPASLPAPLHGGGVVPNPRSIHPSKVMPKPEGARPGEAI
jgi:hypothetical protein